MHDYPPLGNAHVACVKRRSSAANPEEKNHDHPNQSSCHRHRCFGGIGAAVAERLAKDGFTVVVNYAGNGASAAAVTPRTCYASAWQANITAKSAIISIRTFLTSLLFLITREIWPQKSQPEIWPKRPSIFTDGWLILIVRYACPREPGPN